MREHPRQPTMALSIPSNQDSQYPVKRQDIRVSFPPHRRPALQLADGAYPVLDISARGLRILHVGAVRPDFGAHIEGTLQFSDERPPVAVQGLIIRVQAADVAIRCKEGVLPISLILDELNHARAS